MTFSDGDTAVVVEEIDEGGRFKRHHGHGGPHGGHSHHGHGGQRYGEFARVLAEALGTFILTLAILASFVWAPMYGSVNWLIVAATVGLALMAAMAAVGHVSGGGDFNPAVTLGKAIAGRTAWRNVLPYIIGQLLGALMAAFVMWALLPDSFAEALQTTRGALLGSSAPGFGALSPLGQATAGQGGISLTTFDMGVALLAEIIFTAIFVAVVLGATRRAMRRSGLAPILVGATFGMLYLMLWPISRGGLNPARAFGSVVLAHDTELWRQLWVFIVGPLIGAALAGLFYRAFHPGLGHLPDVADVAEVPTYYGDAYYTAEEVSDPVLNVYEPAATTYRTVGTTERAEELRYAAGEGDELIVSDDAVTEDGDRIIFGRDAQVVEDIEEADERA